MPRQRRQQNLRDPAPLLYSCLTTRRSSFPTWLLIVGSTPIPYVIKRSDLGTEVTQLLLSSNRALPVPPLVDDIASVLSWLLYTDHFPLHNCYKSIAVNLEFVCDVNCDYHIHPLDAHFKMSIICMNRILYDFFPRDLVPRALEGVTEYIRGRWGDTIRHAGFQLVLLDAYTFLKSTYGFVKPYFIRNPHP